MSIKEKLRILARMDKLIRLQATGPPEAFASSLGISLRTLYNYIDLIREIGAPVNYSRSSGSFEYTRTGELFIGFFCQEPDSTMKPLC
ncbi:MAG: HTH domain-containing protein [Bacteroidota bacterium]